MKKKLFIWAYTHAGIQTCALTSDGVMLFSISNTDHEKTVFMLFSNNKYMSELYDIKVQDQKKLEAHMYGDLPRDEGVPKDFQIAWDIYKGIAVN